MPSIFETNCTIPSQTYNFVSSPNTRGTIDILWSSLATLLACTYSVLHLNVPDQHHGQRRTAKTKFLRALKYFWTSFVWTLITLFLPELLFAKSIMELLSARQHLRQLKKDLAQADAETWTLTHMFLANMGGFALEYEGIYTEEMYTLDRRRGGFSSQQGARSTGFSEALQSDMPSSVLYQQDEAGNNNYHMDDYGAQRQPEPGMQAESLTDAAAPEIVGRRATRSGEGPYTLFHLDAAQLCQAIIEGDLPAAAPISQEDIDDKSKSDSITKGLAVLQILYFLVSVLVRVGRHLPISQLELATTAFVGCSVFTYGFLFPKPMSVKTATIIRRYREVIPPRIKQFTHDMQFDDGLFRSLWALPGRQDAGSPPPNDKECANQHYQTGTICLVLASVLFGVVHVAGWSLRFPTKVDLWLWRASALATTVVPLIILLLDGNIVEVDDNHRASTIMAMVVGFFGVCIIYACSRLILIVEMFRCLCYLPPEAFVGTWTSNIPHFG